MRFATPLALLLLLLLPLAASMGWPARGPGRQREIFSLGLRLVILACLVLSLAGLEFPRWADNLAVVFLLDVSDSMPEPAVSAAIDYTRQSIASMGPDDQAAVIAFGAEALVDRPMSASRTFEGIDSIPVTNQTDLAEAIRLALALYPPGAARRMVILSDGLDTASTSDPLAVQQAAQLAAASGVQVVSLPFLIEPGPEVLVADVTAPGDLRQDEQFDLRVTLQAAEQTQARVRVLAGGQVAFEEVYSLERGSQSFSLPLTAGQPGFARYTVQVEPVDGDLHYQNNEMEAFSQVLGPPRVLLAAPTPGEPLGFGGDERPDESSALLAALQAAGFTVDEVPPSGMPEALPDLAAYEALVLVDIPARQLSGSQMQAVKSYVRDLGGGLVVVGGPTSYGVGGYYRTPLEEVLPLEMQIKDEQRRPSLAMVFIIDHSGSMADTSGGVMKLELAKEAAIRSVELLSPSDRIGVVAFDESASWVVPLTGLEDREAVIAGIGSLRSGGGTDIMAGLQAMAQAFPADPAKVKHAILMTDGGADPTGIPELVSRLYEANGITLSTVGIGRDAAPFLPQLAELGGGRFHFAADPASIPSILTEETTLATRAYLVEETFFPSQSNPSPILAGIEAVPPLHGYVATSPKEASRVVLVSEQADPILAEWQYGLGRSVAFTSDATGRWARDWVAWDGFASFWAQAVRSTIAGTTPSALDVQIELEGETAHVWVDAQAESGEYLNGYALQANVIAPDGSAETIELEQVAPGRYTGEYKPGVQGAYLVRLTGLPPPGAAAANPVAETAGWVLAYSPEYRQLASEPEALVRLTAQAGGAIAPNDPAQIFTHDRPAPVETRPAWPWLLALGTILLPFDIAARRLVVSRAELRRGFDQVTQRFRRPVPTTPAALPRSQRVQSLLNTVERMRERRRPEPGLEQGTGRSASPSHTSDKPVLSESEKPAQEQQRGEEGQPASTASTLLAAKRKRQERDAKDDER